MSSLEILRRRRYHLFGQVRFRLAQCLIGQIVMSVGHNLQSFYGFFSNKTGYLASNKVDSFCCEKHVWSSSFSLALSKTTFGREKTASLKAELPTNILSQQKLDSMCCGKECLSFPRRRESSISAWIPAFAGMTQSRQSIGQQELDSDVAGILLGVGYRNSNRWRLS